MANFSYINLILAIIFAAGISYFSFKNKFLTNSGIAASALFAIILFGFGSWKWSVPILVFFFSSSILTNVRKRKNRMPEDEIITSSGRDYLQVLSNGLIPIIIFLIYLFSEREILYLLFCSSIATVCADTWGTELGGMRPNKTVSIINFKEVVQGESGGISLMGTCAALIGAFVVGFTSIIWIKNNILDHLIIITLAGFFGSLVDSILGATLQGKYVCNVCGIKTDYKNHCNFKTKKVKGAALIDNNIVNFAASLSGALFSYFLWLIK